jgi:hypothetical protein
MAVPDVSAHCQFNRVRVKLLRRRRAPNATRVFLACVFCNRSLLFGRTRRKQFSYPPRKRIHVRSIKLLTSFGRTLPNTLPGLRIGQAFLFRPRQASSSTSTPCQTEGPFLFQAEKATLAKLFMTFGAGRVPNERENDDLAAFRELADFSVRVFGPLHPSKRLMSFHAVGDGRVNEIAER